MRVCASSVNFLCMGDLAPRCGLLSRMLFTLGCDFARVGTLLRITCAPQVERGRAGVGFFARTDYITQYRGSPERVCGGVFYAGALGWQQLGVQVVGRSATTP